MPSCAKRWALRPPKRCPRTRRLPDVGACTPEMALKNVVLPAPLGPMMPTSSPSRTTASTASTATRPPKRTVRALASSNGVASDKVHLLLAALLARFAPPLLAAPLVAPLAPPGARGLPPLLCVAPTQRRQAAGQVQHADDQQQAERHQVHLRRLQPQRLGQQAEDDRRHQRPPQRRRAADQ